MPPSCRAMDPKSTRAGAGSAQKTLSSLSWWDGERGEKKKGVKRAKKQTKKRWPILEAASGANSDGVFRLAVGHHRLCCTCTCSRGRWEWPEGGRERQPAGAGQSQQRFPQPVFCAR